MDDDLRRRMSPLSDRRGSIPEPMVRVPVQVRPEVASPPVNNSAPNVPDWPQVSVQPPIQPPMYAEVTTEPIQKKRIVRARPFFTRKQLVAGFSIVMVVAVLFGAYSLMFSGKSSASKKGPSLVTNLSKPNFTPLVPKGETQLAKQPASTSFDKAHDSYSYDDLYLGIPIEVSEQPMPSNNSTSLTSNQVISSLAQKYGATVPVSFQKGTAYLGNTNSSNKQIIIFNEDGILGFIQSSMNVQASAWAGYIDSLYQP